MPMLTGHCRKERKNDGIDRLSEQEIDSRCDDQQCKHGLPYDIEDNPQYASSLCTGQLVESMGSLPGQYFRRSKAGEDFGRAHAGALTRSFQKPRPTARSMGPAKTPISPKAARPPSAPNIVSRNGARVMLLMRIGRTMLSTGLTTKIPREEATPLFRDGHPA